MDPLTKSGHHPHDVCARIQPPGSHGHQLDKRSACVWPPGRGRKSDQRRRPRSGRRRNAVVLRGALLSRRGAPPQPPMSQTMRSLHTGKTACPPLVGETACPRAPTQRTRARSCAQRRATWRSASCRPRISRTRRRARRPRAAACSLTAADTWRVAIQDGSGDGEGGNRTCWIGTQAGAVVAGPGLSGSGAGCCSGAMAATGPSRGWDGHGNQGGAVAATAAETARCVGCHGRSSGPVVAAARRGRPSRGGSPGPRWRDRGGLRSAPPGRERRGRQSAAAAGGKKGWT